MEKEKVKFPVDLSELKFQTTVKDSTCLIWDLTPQKDKEGALHAKIYLKKTPEFPRSQDTKNNTTKACCPHHEDDPSLPAELEASVLQYQRQKRKTDAAKQAGSPMTNDQLHIVHEDTAMIVVNKPAGVLCVPGVNNNPSIANVVHDRQVAAQQQQQDIPDHDQCPDPFSMTVHRLDMATSGLVVFGKTKSVVTALHKIFRRDAAQNQSKQERKRKHKRQKQQTTNQEEDTTTTTTTTTSVIKEYEALVCGHLPNNIESGFIDMPLQKDIHHPPFMRVSTPQSEALARQVVDALRERKWTKLTKRNPKPSQTEFRVVAREYYYKGENQKEENDNACIPVTRLSLTPITGRTHQLRVHCAAMGFPILGDPTYGIYGEAAFCAGLYHNTVQIVIAEDDDDDDTNIQQQDCSSETYWRAPIALQKESMDLYPPGEKNMCLHAKRLGFTHPISGQAMEWQVAPDF